MPGSTCTVCVHAKKKEIDFAIVKGESHRSIAKRYGPSSAAVFRHSRHLPNKLLKAVEVNEAVWAGTVIDRMTALYRETAEDRERLRGEGNYELALRHTTVMTKLLEIQARMLGELKETGPALNMNGPITITVQYESKTLVAPVTADSVKQLAT